MNVTLLVPTFQRTDKLERLLEFYHLKAPELKNSLIVLDGSTESISEINARLCDRFQIRYRYFGSKLPISQRIYEGLHLAENPLVVIHPDDDFVLPSGLEWAVGFLNQNKDYVSAHGQYLSFAQPEAGSERRAIQYVHVYQELYTLDEKSPVQRLYRFASSYKPLMYAVHRTDTLIRIFNSINQFIDADDYYFNELLIAFALVLSGKIYHKKAIYMARQQGNPTYQKQLFHLNIYNPNFSDRYVRFRKALAMYFSESIDPGDREQIIDYIFLIYLSKAVNEKAIYKLVCKLAQENPFASKRNTVSPFVKITGLMKKRATPAIPFNRELDDFLRNFYSKNSYEKSISS